jgi:hypothetical protein
MLYEDSNKNGWSHHFKTEDLVHHVYIHNINAMKQLWAIFQMLRSLLSPKLLIFLVIQL